MKQLLDAVGATQSDLAAAAGVSKTAMSLALVHGKWPKRRPAAFRQSVRDFFISRGIAEQQVDDALGALKPETRLQPDPRSSTSIPSTHSKETDDPMLLQNTSLTPAARKYFSLARNPFADDVHSSDDFFMSPDIRYCREVLWDVAKHGGFCALTGESGSGKTTIYEELTERIKRENAPILVITPYVLAMESNDKTGKTLKSAQIAEAVIRALDPTAAIKQASDARFDQAKRLLQASYKAGNTHVLVIEEAHSLPIATLKHLKRWRELKDGFTRLIGVILIGQPELKLRLSAHNPEVREVVQRCEVIEVPPLDRYLQEYVAHKMKRVGISADSLFESGVYDAIRSRLAHVPRNGRSSDAISICYPLVVNNLICRVMNSAAMIGADKINAELVTEA